MSGGQGHVLQALSNLDTLRKFHRSALPVEFWHAFELSEVHCEALQQMGAECRTLQVPGVYGGFQTTMPAILSSSFAEVLWMDTDVTPLLDPELLFETEAFKREGALFWPDLWGQGCHLWGQTAWPNHVAWHLLGIQHNSSDLNHVQEHEAGHVLVDRERHWKALCLANYLATRSFFARVLHGYKDVFRFAWLKMGASGVMLPMRPGLVGVWTKNGQYLGQSLMHFWPLDEYPEPLLDAGPLARFTFEEISTIGLPLPVSAAGKTGRLVPLYVHQKKVAGLAWQDVVTFKQDLGTCIRYVPGGLIEGDHLRDLESWMIEHYHIPLSEILVAMDIKWNNVYEDNFARLSQDPRLTAEDVHRLHRKSPKKEKISNEFKEWLLSCQCDYSNNRWFKILTRAIKGEMKGDDVWLCDQYHDVAEQQYEECPVGYAYVALVCSQVAYRDEGGGKSFDHAIAAVTQLEPRLRECLPHSFWPLKTQELRDFLEKADKQPWFRGNIGMSAETIARFPLTIRRCLPLRDASCWAINGPAEGPSAGVSGGLELSPMFSSCMYCCDPWLAAGPAMQNCFNEEFTRERCCNTEET